MSHYAAEILWQRGAEDFLDNRYSRRHLWRFDGGQEVPASSSPHVVPLPLSDASAVDPEEAFVAAVASCHMLWFLAIAARQGFRIDSYRDLAQGEMTKNPAGKLWVSTVTLRPQVVFSGTLLPDRAQIEHMHHEAHDECFIANSVKTDIQCLPVFDARSA